MKNYNLMMILVLIIFSSIIFLTPSIQAKNKGSTYVELENLPQPRFDHVAFLYNDYIYVFLGFHEYQDPPIPDNYLAKSIIRYNITNNLWETTDTLPIIGWGNYSCIMGDNVFIAGGGMQEGWIRDSVFRYNILTEQIDTMACLPTELINGRGFNDNGSFHILGGHNGYGPVDVNYVYDTTADSWSAMTELPGGLHRNALVKFDSLVYLLGGRGLGGYPTSDINLIYNTNTDSYSYGSDLLVSVQDAGYAILNGEVYIFGGRRSDPPVNDVTGIVQIYNPVTDTWRFGPNLPFPNCDMTAITYDGAIYLIGGWNFDSVYDCAYKYISEYKCGDPNGDDDVNIFDISFLIEYLYLEGPSPIPIESGDVNNDAIANIFDITYLITYLYLDGPEPDCP